MTRQLMILVVLLLGLGLIHTAGTRRPLGPAASKDPYAWLGPMPSTPGYTDLGRRWERLVGQVVNEARTVDVRRFVCKTPAEVGALPMMQSVLRYADNLPGSQDDKALVDGLQQAAARGNWFARTLLLSRLGEADGVTARYQFVQLAEWLHLHRLGHLYVELQNDIWLDSEDHVGAPGSQLSRFVGAAAMRHDYIAQDSVGRALIDLDDPELVAAGGRMLACAAEARAFFQSIRADSTNGVTTTTEVLQGMAD